jgi:two-component system nitrate/nitrite sensor histidine kinase NarX
MSLRQLKLLTIALPTLLIGGFEYIRHDLLLHYLSMEVGNFYITLLTLVLAYLFATWVFRRFEEINRRLAEEQAKRAVYEERERLARELHDTIAQTLFFLGVKLKQGKLEDARSAVAEIDNHVRQAIFNLRTAPEEGSAGFEARLRKWLRDWSELSGIALKMDLAVPEHDLPRSAELQLFAIIQEAFTNIRKHSRAEQASISLRADKREWSLEITDDGVGMTAEALRGVDSASRYGLSLMRRRAEELGATFEAAPASEAGGVRLTLRSKGGERHGGIPHLDR